MVKVAIAGGSGSIGLNIVQAILNGRKHIPIVLSRSSKPIPDNPNVEVRVVDYSNHSTLVSALRDIHTVIVTLVSPDLKEIVANQLALLEAAKEAGVKRFAPSEWAAMNNSGLMLYHPKLEVWDAAKKSGLEVTRFVPGIFINLFAGGSNLPSEKDALAHFAPGNVFIDARAGTADIPGDGTTKVTFTSAQDTARFVAESLDLEKWEEVSGIVGETTTFEEVVDVLDMVTGKKMVRTYVMQGGGERAQKLLENKYLEGVTKSIAAGDFAVEPTLNKKLPHIRPSTVEEYLRKYWEGADWSAPAAATTEKYLSYLWEGEDRSGAASI